MKQIKQNPKRLTISVERVQNPPKVTFGFSYLSDVSWSLCRKPEFFQDWMKHLRLFSGMTWQMLYQAPRHGLGTEKLPLSAIKPSVPMMPMVLENFLVLRATGDNHPMIGFRRGDVFEVVFLESEFGDVYKHG